MEEFKSFLKTVSGNEGSKCNYPTRLDTFGCGCSHDCSYCYAKSLLNFRGLWNPSSPKVASIDRIKKALDKVPKGTVLRLGGMTDCFQPFENKEEITYKAIQALNERDIPYLIVTKSNLVSRGKYMSILRKDLAHIQITVTCTDDLLAKHYEKATSPSERIEAIEKLYDAGFDVALRLSPFIPQFIDKGLDLEIIKRVNCRKMLVEFLRVNNWVKRWFDIDYSQYTLKQSGYLHLPLALKIKYLHLLQCKKEITVCEDFSQHYRYWKQYFNPNKNDCCNLTF